MYKNSISKLKRITSIKLMNFLEENGTYPVIEDYDAAYFQQTPQFFSLLDQYEIKYQIIGKKP